MARSARLLVALLALAVAAPAHAAAPTADQIVARARTLGVGEQAQKLRASFLPGVRLFAGGKDRIGATRLGGEPDLARGATWPTCHGHTLSFLAQISAADLGHGNGTLAVFGDLTEDADGVEVLEEFSGKVGCVVAVRYGRPPLARRATPHGVRTLRRTPVRLRPTLTVPSWDSADDLLGSPQPASFIDPWGELMEETAWGALGHVPPYRPVHQLLGWSAPLQQEPTTSPCKGNRQLLQLDYDEKLGFTLGDAPMLYLTIRPADLRAGRYDRLCGELQDD